MRNMKKKQRQWKRWGTALWFSAGVLILLAGLPHYLNMTAQGFSDKTGAAAAYAETEKVESVSAAAFSNAYKVFMNPRCVNCHPEGDHPLVGDGSRPHPMDVKRGQGGFGKNGLWCSTCHQETNLPGEHMPPGAPDWELPPKEMPMVFENKTARELCLHLKDTEENGGRTPEGIVEHVEDAELVLWGWDPGEGRTPVSMPHKKFVDYMIEWADNGAVCPD